MNSGGITAAADENLEMSRDSHARQSPIVIRNWRYLAVLIIFILVFGGFSAIYFWNQVQWSKGPDFGWSISDNVEGLVALSVHGAAAEAGMKEGDLIVNLNWQDVESLVDVQKIIDRTIGNENVYEVQREGELLELFVINKPLGMGRSLQVYGFTWLLGIVFFCFGAIVFLMKPGASASWAFLLTMFVAGILITYMFTSKLVPTWLGYLVTFALAFQASPIFHLAEVFPVEKHWLGARGRLFIVIPYLVSLLLFLIMAASGSRFSEVPVLWKRLCYVYLFAGIAVFSASTLHTLLTSEKANARARARVVLMGLVIGIGIPLTDELMKLFLGVWFLPHVLFNLIFYCLFPLSIGYSIVKHNLFDIDVFIKRAVGYILLTVLIGAAYIFLGSVMRALVVEPVFGEVSENVYPMLYAVLVVFLFGPVSMRVQAVVDRLFYRQEYNFKETVQRLENSLTSVLDLHEIMERMVKIVRDTLFLDTAGVMAFSGEANAVDRVFYSEDELGNQRLVAAATSAAVGDPVADLVFREKKLITIYDLQEDRRYRSVRDTCLQRFRELHATMAMPIMHGDRIAGIFYLGDKKSGKLFRREDIDLMTTLATRGAVAMENANLVEQMKQEEEVRSNLARYLSPQIVERVVRNDMQVNLGGQRKEVSVLFSDIRGFTTISETWPPDQLVTILNEYMTEMVAVVFENKGSIDKFVGDAIVAVFGSLVEVENHARHAVNAALGMQRRLVDLNIEWQKQYGVELGIGIGINTGEVFLGNIGSPDRMEFTVIGDAVNLAARLEGLTKFYDVGLVVSEFTRKGLDDILCRKLDLVRVKGKHKAVAIYEPVCLVMDADDRLQSELSGYDGALSAYYQQQWDVADEAFRALASQYPDKKLYTLYRDRIAGLRRAGLPAEWDGVFVHTTK